jgi:mono/diheme cytochrome c family protein
MKKNKYLLLISSLLALGLLAAAAAEENFFRQWRRIQASARGESGPIPIQLRQIVNPSLKISDRCVSCHVGMAPGESALRGADVLRPHPPVVHDPAEYGCTVCHGGQGQATEKEDAHGQVEFWPEPMLPREMAWAGCGACHVSLGVPGEKVLREAELAFECLDCYACHRVEGRGGTLRPDGGGMEGPDLSFAGLRGYDAAWHEKHVKKAATESGAWRKSFAPVSEPDQKKLEMFLRTRTGASRLVRAKSVFLSAGCLGCHRVNGAGGDDGPDLSAAGLKDPGRLSFAGVPGGRLLSAWMNEHFRSPISVVVGSLMPAVPLPEDGIRQLTFFTLSLRQRELPDRYLPRDRVRAVRFGEREFATDGETLFGAFCSGCHGPDGMGRRLPGLVAFPGIAHPDFLSIAPEELIVRTIEEGRPGRRMPGWLKPEGLRPEEIRTVAAFLRSLAGVAPQADPRPPRWVVGDASRGRDLFARYCSGCHGENGKGGEGPALNNKVLLAYATDTFLVETIRRGRRGTAMAGFAEPAPIRPALAQADIEAIVTFLRSLEGGKS